MTSFQISVYPLPSLIPSGMIERFSQTGSAVVVIDQLRATTTITTALANGAESVETFLEPADAIRRKQQLLGGGFTVEQIVLGGERGGVRIDGFDYGNSPREYRAMNGKRLLFTTTNGTRAISAAKNASTLLLASFINAAAVLRELQNANDIHIICAGTCGQFTEEDLLTAGCLVERLDRYHRLNTGERFAMNIQSQTVQEMWYKTFPLQQIIGEEKIDTEQLAKKLRASCGGKNLIKLSLDRDIVDASHIDSANIVPRRHSENVFVS
ncbi:MAG: 2-phosphosulfolactate phosphatase [Planctomycetaceae bacterium]|jgi:2-phosphosulfolactate phosphatase|nr:2-phosphosulfolactate phosphatase [Planctomycetaceae bacterium]